ncbi:toll/interleukin-1 receptor domain-containing protein [Corallococcus exercitus]|uniref:Toll/interleukin-1 receptor domain-containing protein n=1 Tax=Corallococcus exercitus TaxID=2316736 RepID=A0A7Y4NIE2_9BACT|nr:toll/interleukin-1 receptor domain-containing protein [Corallococcus exercitus]NOK14561.1 toll/interleukin-1 receptor domain-containing protein [Corallococcus exercitus]
MSSSVSAPPNCFRELLERGFEFHVFISWPSHIQDRGRKIVEELAHSLEDRFKDFRFSKVFWDREALRTEGGKWDAKLRRSLCRSGLMVAVLVPSYFESDYCRTEWNIMEQLQGRRLPTAANETCFLPILLSEEMDLPKEIVDLTYNLSFRQMLSYGNRVRASKAWNEVVDALVSTIKQKLTLLCRALASPPDWAAEEAIAMDAGPKDFDWSKAMQPNIPAGQARKLPVMGASGRKL